MALLTGGGRRKGPVSHNHEFSGVAAMKVGYARVSTCEQELGLQREALTAAGCTIIYDDLGISGAKSDRPGLVAATTALQSGDVLCVWKLDRLGRSLTHLIQILEDVNRIGAGFHSISEAIDTTTPGGKLVFHVLGAIAEFERGLISERTRAGMESARRRGIHCGRPPKLSRGQVEEARALIEAGAATRAAIAVRFGVDIGTLRRALAASG